MGAIVNKTGSKRGTAHLVCGLHFEFLKDLLRLRLGGCHDGRREGNRRDEESEGRVEEVQGNLSGEGERRARPKRANVVGNAPGGPIGFAVLFLYFTTTSLFSCLLVILLFIYSIF